MLLNKMIEMCLRIWLIIGVLPTLPSIETRASEGSQGRANAVSVSLVRGLLW